jgi:membrane-bound ClpP family serine protease
VIVGVVLLLFEAFMPGFGIPGITGTILLIGSIVLAWIQYGAKVGLGMAVCVTALVGIVVSVSLRSLNSGKMAKSEFVLEGTEENNNTEERARIQKLVGQEGVALTALRPVGLAELTEGRRNVQSDGEFIEKGAKIRVQRVSGTTVYVKRV